jgi:hypothetical protein
VLGGSAGDCAVGVAEQGGNVDFEDVEVVEVYSPGPDAYR